VRRLYHDDYNIDNNRKNGYTQRAALPRVADRAPNKALRLSVGAPEQRGNQAELEISSLGQAPACGIVGDKGNSCETALASSYLMRRQCHGLGSMPVPAAEREEHYISTTILRTGIPLLKVRRGSTSI
jgi:hypothetical protein